MDETYVKVASRWTYLYRAVDQHGQVIDVLLSKRRDGAATRAFFSRAMSLGRRPVEATTDRAPVYPRVIDELVSSARHVLEQYATPSKPTMAGSKPDCARCADSNAEVRRAPSPPGTPSCRTYDAATTSPAPTSYRQGGSGPHSRNARSASDRSLPPPA